VEQPVPALEPDVESQLPEIVDHILTAERRRIYLAEKGDQTKMELKTAGRRVLPQLFLRLDKARPVVAAQEYSLYPKQ